MKTFKRYLLVTSLLVGLGVYKLQAQTFDFEQKCDCDTAYLFNDKTLVIGKDTITFADGFSDSELQSLRDSLLSDKEFTDGIYNDVTDSLLEDEAFLDELQDSIDTHLDSVTTSQTHAYYWVDGVIVDSLAFSDVLSDSVLNSLSDSLLADDDFTDSMFSIISDSLLDDTAFLSELQDSIDTHLDSVTTSQTHAYYWVDGTIVDSLAFSDVLSDSVLNTMRDSLLSDKTFTDSMYSIVSDSLLDDTTVLSELKDSIDTYLDSVTISNGKNYYWVRSNIVDSSSATGLDSVSCRNDTLQLFWVNGSIVDSIYSICSNRGWIDFDTTGNMRNGWTMYDKAFGRLSYIVKGTHVRTEGYIVPGITTSDSAVFRIPANLDIIPKRFQKCLVSSNSGGLCELNVLTNGVVDIYNYSGTGKVHFRLDYYLD